jgi:hypothetical protein
LSRVIWGKLNLLRFIPNSRWFVTLILAVAAFAAVFAVWGVPLSSPEADGHWYYGNLHFLTTGEYLFQSDLSYWKQPSQYFPLGGYSALLIFCHYVEKVTGLDWASLVKAIQVALFVLSGVLVYLIARRHGGRLAGVLAGLLFYSHYPFANFSVMVLSENPAVFLWLLSYWLIEKGVLDEEPIFWAVGFLVGGYSMLVRPIFLFPMLLLLAAVAWIRLKRNPAGVLLGLLALFTAPLLHCGLSKSVYGNFSISTGKGLHLWNRVIGVDGSYSLKHRDLFTAIYEYKNSPPRMWWEDAPALARLGVTELDVDRRFLKASLDGIADFPMEYFTGTLVGAKWLMSVTTIELPVFATPSRFFGEIRRNKEVSTPDFPNAVLLNERLLRQQPLYSSPALEKSTSLYYAWANWYHRGWGEVIHAWALWGYLIFGVGLVLVWITDRLPERFLTFALFSVPIVSSIAAVMLEKGHSRYQIPFFPILLILFAGTLSHGATALARWVTTKLGATKDWRTSPQSS